VDLVLVIDTSPSMSYDLCTDIVTDVDGNPVLDVDGNPIPIDNDDDGVANSEDCPAFGTMTGGDGIPESDVARCNISPAPLACEPFETVKRDAKDLVRRMNFPYDRVAIVGFGREADVYLELYECDLPDKDAKRDCIWGEIDKMNVEREPTPADCPGWKPDPSGCTSTNTGDGLLLAGNIFGDTEHQRLEAIWVVVLLSDGVANAALRADSTWICPGPSTWDVPPYCQDGDPGFSLAPPRKDIDPLFDADDHARKMALFVGCPSELPDDPKDRGPCSKPGNGAVIFTIGLGDAVVNYDRGGPDPKVGGELLQFIAAVADGFPGADPCESFDPTENCGNYYFVKEVSELEAVFEEIASRIYTKLNH
jgi:hypothetical protein